MLARPKTKFQLSLGYKSHIVMAPVQNESGGKSFTISSRIYPACTCTRPENSFVLCRTCLLKLSVFRILTGIEKKTEANSASWSKTSDGTASSKNFNGKM